MRTEREWRKLTEAHEILRECFGDNGVWADPSRYRRQCWTRDFGLAIQPLLLQMGQVLDVEMAERHLRSLEARQREDGQIPILFLDGWRGHARFLADKTRRSFRDGKVSFMLGRYLQGQLGQLTPGTRDSELLYVVAALEHQKATGKLPVSVESVVRALEYIDRNLVDSRGLLLGADWRDTMHEQLGDKALLTNNSLLCHAYDLVDELVRPHAPNARILQKTRDFRRTINEVFWDGSLLQDWPGNDKDAFASKQRFDPLGASLAVLFDVIPPERYGDVWTGFDAVNTDYGVTIKCRHNPVSAEEAEVIERTDGRVVWPFVVGFAAMAMRKMYEDTGNRFHDARRQLNKLTSHEGFREWYDPETGKGYGAQRQLWSATLYRRAFMMLDITED